MAGLLDLFGGDATQPGALYGGLLSPQQNSALGYRGLLAAAGALGQAAMPSRLPIPIGAALGQAAGAMGSAQDEAALNAMRGQLVGLQGQSLASDLAIRKQLAGLLPGLAGAGGAGASPLTGASPAGGGEVGSPAPNASVNDNSAIGAGQLYEFLAQNGATPNEAAMLTSAANSESSFRPDITHDGGIGYGLFGHNTDRLAAMRQFAGVGPNDPVPWQKQALFALSELHGSESKAGAMVNSATTPEQLTDAQLAFERPNLNIAGGNRGQRLASTREYMASPPGAKPTQLAQANTGTVTDAVPQPPSGAPQGLLPPQAPGSDTLRVGGAGGLLAPPQPTATPFTNAPPINGVGAPAPGPQGGLLAPQAPQVAQAAAPRPPMPAAAPGMGIGVPPVPNIDPRALAAASSLAQLGHMGDVFGPLEKFYYQSPGYLGQAEAAKAAGALPAHNAETQFKTNEDIRAAYAKPADLRTNGLLIVPGTGQILGRNPAVPEGYTVGGTATNPIAEPIPGALEGISKVAAAQKGGGYQAEFGAVPGVQFTGNAANLSQPQPAPQTKPVTTSQGTQLPPLTEQFMPQSPGELEHAIPAWQKKTDDWNAGIAPARQAEMRLGTIAQAFKLTETGAFETHKAELATTLKALGIDPSLVTGTNPAAVQMALHDNILTTLPLLKAATPRPSQIEFMSVSENREHPNLQPAANLRMLTEDLALVRQAQQLPADWNAAQQQGWRNPQSFETAWSRLNPLDSTRDQIEKEIGPLKGMSGNTTPKQTAPEGTIINGPNGQRLQNRGGQWLDLQTLKPYSPGQ